MIRAVIIADDLTGANDTGAMLADLGFSAVSSPFGVEIDEANYTDVLTINADSRAMSSDTAYKTIRSLTEQYGQGIQLLSKRIDTTLRGNVGAEIDAVLDGFGEPASACVVTAAPRANRTCIDGKVYLSGKLLEHTDISKDVRCPIDTSEVGEMIRRQSNRKIANIYLNDVRGDLANKLEETNEEIIVFDAETDEDIQLIAQAISSLKRRIIAIDPGNFTRAYAQQIMKNHQGLTLLLIGSQSEPSKKQLDYLVSHHQLVPVIPQLEKLTSSDCQAEYDRILEILKGQSRSNNMLCITLIGTKVDSDTRNNAQSISDGFANLGAHILQSLPGIDLCYASGGDVSQSLMKALGIKALSLVSEVIPLAVYSKVIGGRYHGLKLLTKGGMIGSEDAIDFMIKSVRERNGGEKE